MIPLTLLSCAAAGDALGLPFQGRKPVPRVPEGFVPAPDDYRSDPVRFSKPGTYSWITQIALALCDSLLRPGPFLPRFQSLLNCGLREGPEESTGIFRNLPEHLHPLLAAVQEGRPLPFALPHLSLLSLPFFLKHNTLPGRAFEELFQTCLLFSSHLLTASTAGALLAVLFTLRDDPTTSPAAILKRSADLLAGEEEKLLQRHSSACELLSLSHSASASSTLKLLSETIGSGGKEISSRISMNASRLSGLPIPRASHPWPLACVPHAIALGLEHPFPEAALIAAGCGGESSLTASLAALLSGLAFPAGPAGTTLLSGLANRKQINLREESFRTGKTSPEIKDFLEMERPITEASRLELLRHRKFSPQKIQPREKPPEPSAALPAAIPDKKNKRLWKSYILQKTKQKRQRRK